MGDDNDHTEENGEREADQHRTSPRITPLLPSRLDGEANEVRYSENEGVEKSNSNEPPVLSGLYDNV